LNEKDLKRCFDSVTPSFEQKQKMLTTILQNKKGGIRPAKRARKKIPALAAVIAISILTITTAFAINFGWNEKLINYFNIAENQMHLLEDAVDIPEATLTKNGVSITVKQTLADSMGVYVLYEMLVPDDIELSVEITWEIDYIRVTTEQTGADYSTAVIGQDILEQSAHQRTGLFHFIPSEPIANGTMQLYFRNLGYYKTLIEDDDSRTVDFIPLIEGEWDLKWNFIYKDTSKIVTPNQLMSVNGNHNTITKISVSPISICLFARGEEDAILAEQVHVYFKDGRQITYDAKDENSLFGCTLIDESEMIYDYQFYYRFDRMIAPDEIESVEIGNVMVSMT